MPYPPLPHPLPLPQSQRQRTSTFRGENIIISEVQSGVSCFHESARALLIVSVSITVFSPLIHFLLPLSHSISVALTFLSVGCNTTGRCGQESSGFQSKINGYLFDETPGTHLPARPPLFGVGVFPALLSFTLLISFAPRTGCCQDVLRGCAGG